MCVGSNQSVIVTASWHADISTPSQHCYDTADAAMPEKRYTQRLAEPSLVNERENGNVTNVIFLSSIFMTRTVRTRRFGRVHFDAAVGAAAGWGAAPMTVFTAFSKFAENRRTVFFTVPTDV